MFKLFGNFRFNLFSVNEWHYTVDRDKKQIAAKQNPMLNFMKVSPLN